MTNSPPYPPSRGRQSPQITGRNSALRTPLRSSLTPKVLIYTMIGTVLNNRNRIVVINRGRRRSATCRCDVSTPSITLLELGSTGSDLAQSSQLPSPHTTTLTNAAQHQSPPAGYVSQSSWKPPSQKRSQILQLQALLGCEDLLAPPQDSAKQNAMQMPSLQIRSLFAKNQDTLRHWCIKQSSRQT
jgi:hypothetical protein